MPDWLQAFAEISPVTLTADAARAYALDGGVPDSLAGRGRLDRRPARGLHPAVRLAIPADELSRSGFGISSRGELDRVLPADPTAAAPF